jgi:hypothetical protein
MMMEGMQGKSSKGVEKAETVEALPVEGTREYHRLNLYYPSSSL